MDDVLGANDNYQTITRQVVLILVLMDDVLGGKRWGTKRYYNLKVLILVLMDDVLGDIV